MDFIAKIKLKHKKYLGIIFVLSVASFFSLPKKYEAIILVVFPFLTFVRYGYLNFSSTNKLADYLVLNHKKELDKLRINTSKTGFNRIQVEMIHKQKELSNISSQIKNDLELYLSMENL